jgi:hypothetical protein
MVGRMIDLHTHILPALDDGAATLAESIGMARAAAAEGITTVVATPHVRDHYPTTAAEMEQAVATLGNALSLEGIQLDVETGGEIGAGPAGAARRRRARALRPRRSETTCCSSALTVAGRSTSPQRCTSCAAKASRSSSPTRSETPRPTQNV